jgi:hypothetical protein
MDNALGMKLRDAPVSNSLGLMFPEWQIVVILFRSVYRALSFLYSYHSRHHCVLRYHLIITPSLH